MKMPDRGKEGQRFNYVVGAGYWGYVVCLLAATIRVTIHYLTPVPGGGTGCQCCERLTGMDLDGDGRVGGRSMEREASRARFTGVNKGGGEIALEPRVVKEGLTKEELETVSP